MQIHEVQREHPNKTKTRVGRGGKRGKTSGRGHKGQNARAGSTPRPEIRDFIKKLPKKRGYKFNSHQIKPEVVNVSLLEKNFADGEKVTPLALLEKNLVRRSKGRVPKVKILGSGELSKKLDISKTLVSKEAQVKIEKAGGKVSP